jgi:glucose-6-phosphate 1-dehydrogenase
VPHLPFGDDLGSPAANQLHIGLDGPYDLSLRLTGIEAGRRRRLVPLALDTPLPAEELPAHSRVLLDVLTRDTRLSIRGDEVEEAWRVLTPVLRGWADDLVPLEEYPAGSSGPPHAGGPPWARITRGVLHVAGGMDCKPRTLSTATAMRCPAPSSTRSVIPASKGV